MRKLPIVIGAIIILVSTIISGYGIATAPADKLTDDQRELRTELENNQKAMIAQHSVFALSEMSPHVKTPVETHTPSPVIQTPYITVPPESTPDTSPFAEPEPTDEPIVEPADEPNTKQADIPLDEPADSDGFIFTAIGDSVMLGAYPALKEKFPNSWIDATKSRQVWDCLSIIKSLEKDGHLYDTVIIALCTNGTFNKSVGQDIIDYLGESRTIYWVTGFGESLSWMSDANEMIHTLADENSNVHIIDWNGEGAEHPEWFRDDGIHLRSDGQIGYADFLLSNLT